MENFDNPHINVQQKFFKLLNSNKDKILKFKLYKDSEVGLCLQSQIKSNINLINYQIE